MATSPEEFWALYSAYYGVADLVHYQRLAGLMPTGKLDTPTVHALRQPRCGVRDDLRLTEEARWRKNRLTYHVQSYVVGIDSGTVDDILRAAWKCWEDVCDVKLSQVKAAELADVVISTGRGPRAGFDGPSGTLAWAQLPNGSDGPLLMRFDLDEAWAVGTGAGVLLLNVAAHEFGHLLGLDHSSQRGALMAPFYSRPISRPQANDDISRIQAYYGPPLGGPAPDPAPTGGNTVTKELIRAVLRGAISAFAAYAAKTWNPLDDYAAKFLAEREEWLLEQVLKRLPAGLPITEETITAAFTQTVAEMSA